MDGQTDRWKDGWKNRWTNRQTDSNWAVLFFGQVFISTPWKYMIWLFNNFLFTFPGPFSYLHYCYQQMTKVAAREKKVKIVFYHTKPCRSWWESWSIVFINIPLNCNPSPRPHPIKKGLKVRDTYCHLWNVWYTCTYTWNSFLPFHHMSYKAEACCENFSHLWCRSPWIS